MRAPKDPPPHSLDACNAVGLVKLPQYTIPIYNNIQSHSVIQSHSLDARNVVGLIKLPLQQERLVAALTRDGHLLLDL